MTELSADPVAARWNGTIDFTEITMDRNFALFLVSLVLSITWVVYITYYNSRVLGFILTRLINKFYFQDENFKIGSFTLNALSGKIMFRDIVYINYDYTLRIQDGYLIFRWWRSYIPKDVSEDLSHSDTRVSIMLNGFELHVYNRSDMYHELEKIFDLEPFIKQNQGDSSVDQEKAMNDANEKRRRAQDAVRSEAAMARTWRDLIPVIKIDICSGRVVFGNRLIPTTLSISVEESHLMYSTKPPASSLDHLMHFVKAKAENCKVLLAPSPNYTALADEPPRFMGEGFVVMSSNYIELYFYMDEPGLVPEHPVLLQLANGDVVESAPPIWGVDIKCGKGTDFSYGPWADRQRDHLFKFFFPPNFKNLEITPQPKPGDRRQMQSFDIRLSTLNEATIDILFTKNKETNAVHINIGAGSYLEVTLPWIVLQDGYTTKITGQLLHLEATTSLQYRSLAESETLEYNVKCHYPLVWNHHQSWQLSFTGCKATAHFVYTHIDFFQDLVNDWATKARPDILSFVPYTWKISILLKECELVTLSNQYNWVDCSSTNQENNHVAFCGDLLDVSFDLPFVDFLPDVIPLKIWIQGESVDMSLYLPEVNTSRQLLLSIDKNMKITPCRLKPSKWRRKCVKAQGWVECWSVPIIALSIRYIYHPVPPLGPEPQADITTPEKEEILLSPMRIPRHQRKKPHLNWTLTGDKFDRTVLPPDKVSLELEVGPSILFVYGTIFTGFMHLLDNIFGEDQTFTDLQKAPTVNPFQSNENQHSKMQDRSSIQNADISLDDSSDSIKGPFDPRRYRPLDVTVSIIIHDIQAHLVKNCSENEPPCPIVLIERFGFEMDKSFKETKLQLLLSPSILISSNNSRTFSGQGPLHQGHLMLSSFQLRGHGFFSDTNRSVDEETVEYAWMMELQLGQLTGRVTLPQLYHVISFLETFALLIADEENELVRPNQIRNCHHGINNLVCPQTDHAAKYRCPSSNDIKYKMIRVGVDLIDVYLADTNTTLQTWLSPVRFSVCNLHGPGFGTGVTALIPNIKLALFTQTNMQSNTCHNSTGSNTSHIKMPENEKWVGVGSVTLGPVLFEAASSLPQVPNNLHIVQQKFLKLHDEKTKRLWYLWNNDKTGLCGCNGGCSFFGSNRNGLNFYRPNPTDLQQGVNVAMFNVLEVLGEYGYGQSLLHPGQLVFHTPPYNSLNVCLQPAVSLIPSPLPQFLNKSPQSLERRSITRRFSYTSINKGSNNMVSSTKSDVPYARLVDTSMSLGNSKIDSDSKLNKSVLCVPQMESSVSDSKLALNSGIKDQCSGINKKSPSIVESFTVPRTAAKAVAASESHYSLNYPIQPDEVMPLDAKRTTSITSENHSEAFFSADEETLPSRASSLKHSFRNSQKIQKERGLSVTDTGNMKLKAPVTKLDSDGLEIASLSTGLQADSESGSMSSNSFISAISSQEDMGLVNLNIQNSKPIIDSPLLMASYMQNLPQYKCSNWLNCSLPYGTDAFTLPLFRRTEDGSLIYVGQKYLPHFDPIGKANIFKLISKKDSANQHGPYSTLPPNFNSHNKSHPFPQAWWDLQQNTQDSQENNTDNSSITTVTTTSDSKFGIQIKLRGEVNVTLSPLVLESLQKFLESLTPVLANVHPITFISHMRLLCISSVMSSNVLKQNQNVQNWLPQLDKFHSLNQKDGKTKLSTITETNVYEENISDQTHATVNIPKINVIFIQSSVIEDMISFSALDNISDLTCVSLFGVSIENVTARFVSSKKTLESVQLFYRPTLKTSGSKKSFGIMKGPRALIAAQSSSRKVGQEKGEPVYVEAPVEQFEDTTFEITIGKLQGQFRQLPNESSQLKDVRITSIPPQHSKVSFNFIRLDNLEEEDIINKKETDSNTQFERLGHIMFECGIEGVSIKANKHSQTQKPTEEKIPLKADNESCRDSVKSDDIKQDKPKRTSGIEDLFRKKDSTSSKPSTPNLGATQTAPQVPPAEASTPGPEAESSNNSGGSTIVPKQDDNASSCSIDIKSVSFNFAAPPHTNVYKKHELSNMECSVMRVSRAVCAWQVPWGGANGEWARVNRASHSRRNASAAALMAHAIESHHSALQYLPKSRYGRHTFMGRTLREEPSLQLLTIILRFALHADAAALQADLAQRHLPSLSTLKQGVIVLCRQWKNILYTSLLLEHNFKNKAMKPLNVTFALPDLIEESNEGWQQYQLEVDPLDENCLLLDMDVEDGANPTAKSEKDSPRPASLPSATPPLSARAAQGRGSLGFPSFTLPKKSSFQDDNGANYGSLKEDMTAMGSDQSLSSHHGSNENVNDKAREDLYQWMAKQQPVHIQASESRPCSVGVRALRGCALYPVVGPGLLDAHLVFQPLLRALGVRATQLPTDETKAKLTGDSQPTLESLGSKLTLLAWMDSFKIDLVVSDAYDKKNKKTTKGPQSPYLSESGAFLSEKVCVEVEVKRVADMSVDDLVQRKNVLYISRGQLNKHISTIVNFNVSVRFLSQQVNMPLLRLLHQINDVYQNVKETQVEIRNRNKITRRESKHASSSVSDIQEEKPLSVSSLEKEWKYSPPASTEPLSRPQSFAQKLRSTGKTVKGKLGYSSLNEGGHTPLTHEPVVVSESIASMGPNPLPNSPERHLAPRCWQTVYQLLQLYAGVPDHHTITHRFSVSTDIPSYNHSACRRIPSNNTPSGIVVRGTARIHRCRALASLSGLKLETELTSLQASVTGSKARPLTLNGHIARATLLLKEGEPHQHLPVVRVGVGRSAIGLRISLSSDEGSLWSSVGPVRVDLPQHPVALHGLVARSSKHLSSTLQELGVTRGTLSRKEDIPPTPRPPPQTNTPHPLFTHAIQLNLMLQSLSITAALLPSLQAQYKMEQVHSSGVTGPKPHFNINLPQHSLSFVTKLQQSGSIILPPMASISLPLVRIQSRVLWASGGVGIDGALLSAGPFLCATADIGTFDHTLSTDLLNHLVFAQKVFMKEVNEVVQKVYGGEKPVPLWSEDESSPSQLSKILFSLTIRIKRIQLTATTLSNCAVRLETGTVELHLSNRVQNITCADNTHGRLFAKVQVDLNLSLGQLIRNAMFEEVEPEYQQYAFFNTRIVCRNAFQEEMVSGEEKEVVLIKLRRPLVYIQPIAVDKAVLVWLNYKTAYKYWTEQRRGLNRDVLDATQQIFEKVQLTSQLSSPQISTLFLQLTVDDIGICLPLNQPPMSGLASSGSVGSEGRSCVVVTVEHSIVGAVSRSALVSQGRFVGLCLRFAHDFSSSLDDWRPSPNTRNLCRVSEGTYEVCSRTAAPTPTENAKWFLNVSWQMEGVDINLDVNVGKQLSALGHTLTMITGFEEDDPMKTDYDSDLDDEADISKDSQESIVVRRRSAEPLPAFVFDSRLDAKQRSRLIERELTEQAKLINDLRSLGASHSTVEHEMQRLHDLEAIAFKDFRRDMIQKIRRQSVRASSMTKEKFGLGSNRSHSFVAPHTPIAHDIIDVEPPLTLSESNELMDEEHRLADIIEGNSWSSVESELIAGPSRSASVRGRRSPPLMQRQSSLPADTSQNIHTNQSPLPPSPPPVENKNQNKKHQEPNVDFELDVKVHINSGKCVLHTKEIKDDDIKMGSRNRSSSGRDSPPTARRHRSTDKTVFRVPGLHTEVHYESLVITDSRRPTNKKASLFAWITLQSIPEETIISPHILDFLEQTLEPIPTKIYSAPQPESVGPSSEMTPSASFPVDVVVHFHSLPSTFRFSCLPASRVECRLRLPDLTIVFSSDRQSPSLSGGGVCVTGCVNDFSVHVFHPYGGVGQTRHQRKDSLSINVEFVKFHLARSRRLDHDRAVVRFSTIVDVGSASFKYDMRRLSEILAFPRAWYRRSIVRRMFLGDTNAHRHNSTGSRNAPVSPVMPQREKVKTVDHQKSKENVLPSTGSAEWETLVLFAVNFTRLNVQMNMGNVMGNVSWQSHGLQISGRLQASSNRRRSLQLRLALHDSALDARAGIVGGAFSIDDLCTSLHVSGVLDRAKHSCWVRSKSVCLRLEYMGASNVLARGSNLDATIRDSWTDRADTSSIILAHGKLSWHQLQLLISRSTTPDLIKMQIKLEEFFTQQFNSSKRVFNSLRPDYSASAFTEKKDAINNSGPYMPRLKHHRHWQKVLEQVLLLQTDSSKQYVVGGTMELQGSNISLACFHGNSFKAKSWALFSLKEPCISFATEAQPLNQIDGVGVHVVQSLTASLGSGSSHGPVSMATVVRMTRSVMFPPQFKTLHEWFHYAFAQSEIDAIEEFPTCVVGVGAPTGERSSARISREVIFALPAMQVHLRTRHEQGNKTPTAGDEKPTVECSFITEFEDHIFVSVDAEAFLFLHDLISSYIKEKDRVLYGNRGPWNDPPPSGSTSKEKSNDDNEQKESLTQDYRDYRCVTWHLEPTVRLLSWGGKSIEPYGVDYILQKLGFSHARTTIPKWLQRGTLDPLDKILSLAMLKLIAILPQKAVDK